MTFHGKPRMDKETFDHVQESPWVVWLPLVLLAIPSIMLGYVLFMPMLFNVPSLLQSSLFVLPEHDVLAKLAHEVHSPLASALHAPFTLTFWLAVSGAVIAWICYIAIPTIPGVLATKFRWIYNILMNKYGFDAFNNKVILPFIQGLGTLFYKAGDQKLIDGLVVNGSGSMVKWFSAKGRLIQDGNLFRYATVMVLGVLAFLCWLVLG